MISEVSVHSSFQVSWLQEHGTVRLSHGRQATERERVPDKVYSLKDMPWWPISCWTLSWSFPSHLHQQQQWGYALQWNEPFRRGHFTSNQWQMLKAVLMIWFKGLIIELKIISEKMHQNVESQSCAFMKIPLNEGRFGARRWILGKGMVSQGVCRR